MSKPERPSTASSSETADGGHPYWWCHHLEHPAWCKVTHEDGDFSTDRDCLSGWERQVRLTLPDAARIRRQDRGEFEFDIHPAELCVFLHQRYRECAPRIVLSPDPTNHGTRYDLTHDEAEQLGHALLEAVLLIDGQPIQQHQDPPPFG